MFKKTILAIATASIALSAGAAEAKSKKAKRAAQIPTCTQSVGTVAVVDPENRWWYNYKLESPQNIIKFLALKSGCFRVVDRSRGLNASQVEREMAANGDLQADSNFGKGQVKAADYFLVPDLVNANKKAGGFGVGGAILGSLGGSWLGGSRGKIGINKKEANVTLTLVDARTTESVRLTEGYAKKKNLKWSLGGGAGSFFGGPIAGLEIGSYTNSDIGQVITIAYIDAFKDMVQQMGGTLNED